MGVGVCRRGLLHMGGNAVACVAEVAAGPTEGAVENWQTH